MKELIVNSIKSLNAWILGTERSLQDARAELYEAEIKGWPLEGKQRIVKRFEERIDGLKEEKKELWNKLNEIYEAESK